MKPPTVVIGTTDALPMLRDRLGADGRLQMFSVTEAFEALEFILKKKPKLVALDHDFSSSPRGRALIERIAQDQALVHCEVRVLTRDVVPKAAGVTHDPPDVTVQTVAGDVVRRPLDLQGTRRVARVRMAPDVGVLVEGTPGMLVDLSIAGAQVLSSIVLKPNQRVRVQMSDTVGAIRCKGTVAWALFEMPKGQPTRYRVGVEFAGADADALSAFATRHEAVAPAAAEAATSAADRRG